MNKVEESFNALEPKQQRRYETIGKKRGESANDAYAAHVADELFLKLLSKGSASLEKGLQDVARVIPDKKGEKEIVHWDRVAHAALEQGDYALLDKMSSKIRTFVGEKHARALALDDVSKWVRENNVQQLSNLLSARSVFVENIVFPSGMRRKLDLSQLMAMEQKGMTHLDILTKEIKLMKNPILQRRYSPDTRDEDTLKEKETILSACKAAILVTLHTSKSSDGYIAQMPSVGIPFEEIMRRTAYLGVVKVSEIRDVFNGPEIKHAIIGLLAKSISEAPLRDYAKAFVDGLPEYVLFAQKARFSSLVSQLLDTGLYSREDIAALQDQVLEKVRKNSQQTHVIEILQKALKEKTA